MNEYRKLKISFAEGLGSAPSGVVLSIFWTSKKWRGERGGAPSVYVSDVSLNTSEDLPITIIWSFSLNT